MQSEWSRSEEDVGNLLHLEHINLTQPDQSLATLFYVVGLGLTRDPYLMTGIHNMWINAGKTQFHLPAGRPQKLRGRIGVVMPDAASLMERLRSVEPLLADTQFKWQAREGFVAVRCPWGNEFEVHEPHAMRFGTAALGIAFIEFDVPPGTSEGIEAFYVQVLGGRSRTEASMKSSHPASATSATSVIQVGRSQSLRFRETEEAIAPYDGHHVQVYVADFSGPHRKLGELGLVSEESDRHQYRFKDIRNRVDEAPLFTLEHEVRSMSHPLFARPLVNRNPSQANRSYIAGKDEFSAP